MSFNLAPKKHLLYFLLAAIFIFFASQYIASNYALPQWITIKIKSEKSILLDVYYDVGEGFEEKNKTNQKIMGSSDFQTIRVLLPFKRLKSIRIDPLTDQGIVYIKSLKISSLFHRKHVWASHDMLNSFSPQNDIRRFEVIDGVLLIESGGSDPFFEHVERFPEINKIKPGYLAAFILFVFLGTFLFYSILRIIYFRFMPKFIAISNIPGGYLIGFIAAFVLILNFQKLQLYFLSDDFEFFLKYQSLKDVFAGSAAYHLNPITYFFVFYLGNYLFGFKPLAFHIITLFLHILNILLVYKLAFTLFRSKWTSFAASLLFATYFMNYEVVNWITGAFYLLLATFYVSTLLLFIKHLQGKKTKHYVFFLLTFTLSLFTMEQGVTLLGVCIVLGTLSLVDTKSFRSFSPRQKSLFLLKNSVLYIFPFIILVSFFGLKHFIGQKFIVNTQTFETFIKTIYDSVWHLLIPYPYGISNDILYGTSKWNYRAVLLIALIVIFSYQGVKHLKKRSGEVSRNSGRIYSSDVLTYFFLVSCILIYVIPQSIATVIQARYFYLPSVFSSILLGSLLVKSLSALVKKNNHIRLMFHSWLVFFIAGTIPLNMIFLHEQYHYWQTASQITKNVIQDTKLYIPDGAQEINIYYVNMPDGVYGQKNFSWPNAYLFRNGIPEAFPLAYPQLKTGLIKAYRTADNGVLTSHEHQFMRRDELSQLGMSKSNLLLEFDPTIKTIRKLAE